jgi:ribosomal silencing factor RsfS
MEFTQTVLKKRMKLEERKKGKWVLFDANDKIVVITTDKYIIKRIISK